jgi:hypothetical protein
MFLMAAGLLRGRDRIDVFVRVVNAGALELFILERGSVVFQLGRLNSVGNSVSFGLSSGFVLKGPYPSPFVDRTDSGVFN